MDNEASEIGTFVFLGRRGVNKKTQRNVWSLVSGSGVEARLVGSPLYFDVKKTGSRADSAAPGAMFSIPFGKAETGVSFLYFGKAEYLGVWPDDSRRTAWAAEDRASRDVVILEASQRKLASANALEEVLEPLRSVYRKASRPQRVALLAAVLEYIAG